MTDATGIGHKRGNQSDGYAVVAHSQPGANTNYRNGAEVPDAKHERHHDRRQRLGSDALGPSGLVDLCELGFGLVLLIKGDHGALAAQPLLGDAVHAPDGSLVCPKTRARCLADAGDHKHGHRDRDEYRQGQSPVEHDHDREQRCDLYECPEDGEQVLAQQLVDRIDVVGDTTHEIAGAVAVEEPHGQRLQPSREVLAHRGHNTLRDTSDQPAVHQ